MSYFEAGYDWGCASARRDVVMLAVWSQFLCRPTCQPAQLALRSKAMTAPTRDDSSSKLAPIEQPDEKAFAPQSEQPSTPPPTPPKKLGRMRALDGLRFVAAVGDRKSTRLNSSHVAISYAVFCLKKKRSSRRRRTPRTESTVLV